MNIFLFSESRALQPSRWSIAIKHRSDMYILLRTWKTFSYRYLKVWCFYFASLLLSWLSHLCLVTLGLCRTSAFIRSLYWLLPHEQLRFCRSAHFLCLVLSENWLHINTLMIFNELIVSLLTESAYRDKYTMLDSVGFVSAAALRKSDFRLWARIRCR